MKTYHHLVAIASLAVISLASCKKDKEEPISPVGNASGVYVAFSHGYQWDFRSAKLWKDGVFQNLTDSNSMVYLNSVFVSQNGDTYVAGCECSSLDSFGLAMVDDCKVVLWKNNVKQALTDAFFEVSESFVFVSDNGDEYVASTEPDNISGTRIVKLWKNGIKQTVSDGTKSCEVTGLVVSGNDVYISGLQYSSPGSIATLWKNGVAQNLTNGTLYGTATSVAVSGGDVYVTVTENNGSVQLLKNGVAQSLSPAPTNLVDVFVASSDVYVLGEWTGVKYTVWKNGSVLHELKPTDSDFQSMFAQSLYVSGSDVYVSGVIITPDSKNYGVLWKNDETPQKLSNTPTGVADVPSVFVR